LCQRSTADRAVLIQQQLRAVKAAILVQLLRPFQVCDALVDLVVLLAQQGGIEPRRRVGWIQAFGEIEFVVGSFPVERVGVGFPEIAAQQGSLRFQRGGDQKILPAAVVAPPNSAKPAPQPGVAERCVNLQGTIEPFRRFRVPVAPGQQEAFQRDRLGVARIHGKAAFQGIHGCRGASKAEFQFGHPRPGEPEIRRSVRRLFRQFESGAQ
jgi:hypothetical protein